MDPHSNPRGNSSTRATSIPVPCLSLPQQAEHKFFEHRKRYATMHRRILSFHELLLLQFKAGNKIWREYFSWPLITLHRVRYRRRLRDIPGPCFASILPIDRILSTYNGHQFQRHLVYHAKYGQLVRVGPNHVSLGESEQILNLYNITSKFSKVSEVTSIFPLSKSLLMLDARRAISTPFSTPNRP